MLYPSIKRQIFIAETDFGAKSPTIAVPLTMRNCFLVTVSNHPVAANMQHYPSVHCPQLIYRLDTARAQQSLRSPVPRSVFLPTAHLQPSFHCDLAPLAHIFCKVFGAFSPDNAPDKIGDHIAIFVWQAIDGHGNSTGWRARWRIAQFWISGQPTDQYHFVMIPPSISFHIPGTGSFLVSIS